MKKTACLMVGAAVLFALSNTSLGDMTLPYFEDFDSVGYLELSQAWTLAHHGNSPVLTDSGNSHSGTISITDPGANCGMQTQPFVSGPMIGHESGISLWWRKGDYGTPNNEDDRVRIDVWANHTQYALTLVIWDGAVRNDSDLSEVPISGLQLDTWYKVELVLNRKLDNSGYLPEATVRVFNADDTLFGSGVLTAGKGSRIVPDAIQKFDVSFLKDKGIFVDDISIFEGAIIPEPATMSLLALGAVALLRKKR